MKRVVVIGAGPSGLTAAYELLTKSHEFEVTIVEESKDIGGISKTVCYNGNRMDIGGHRFFSKNSSVMSWWLNMMPLQGAPTMDDLITNRECRLVSGGPDPEKEDRVMLARNRVSRIYFAKRFFDYPLQLKLEIFQNIGLKKAIAAGFSYINSNIFKRSEKTLEDFYINRFGRTLYSMFFESYTEKVWGRHPNKIAADWGAQRVKGLSLFRFLLDSIKGFLFGKKKKTTETSLIEEFYYPKYGPGQMWELVAKEINKKGGKILLEHHVQSVNCDNNNIKSVSCNTANGIVELEADIVISSMPLKDLVAALDGLHISNSIKNIASGLPYRDFITVGLLVDRLKIKNTTKIKTIADVVPDCWIYIQEPDVKVGRLQIFNNWSPYLVKDSHKFVWIGLEFFCNENDSLWAMADKDLIDFATKEMVKIQILTENDIHDSHVIKVKKAYPAYFDTYYQIDTLRKWIDNIDGLYCVGRNGQHRYNNMDHSMLTAFYCVDAILGHTSTKADIWKVNSEAEYHEQGAA